MSTILIVTLSISSILPNASMVSVYAKENSTHLNEQSEKLAMPKEEDYISQNDSGIETYSAATKVVKSAIKFIAKHKSASADVIEKVAGKTVRKGFLKHYSKICKFLKPLLKWEEIPAQAVHDAVFKGLYNSGVSRKVATNIALAIKEGLFKVL